MEGRSYKPPFLQQGGVFRPAIYLLKYAFSILDNMKYEEVLQVLANYNDYIKNVCKKTAEDYPVCEVYADLREGHKTIDSYIAQCNEEAKANGVQATIDGDTIPANMVPVAPADESGDSSESSE